jgi:polyisoprenoid-binding protein YceI
MRSIRILPVVAAAVLVALPAGAQSSKTPAKTPAGKSAVAAPATARVANAAALTNFAIDATHSELSFRIRHLLGRVNGGFGEWGGTIAIDTVTPANSKVDVTIKTASIDTKNAQRDGHLRSPDFFAADSFPTITFKSRNVVKQDNRIRILGDLTMRGVTKPVVLIGDYAGAFKDPWGKTRVAFTASTTVNRNDFGVSYNKAVETGTMLGEDVTIEIALEAVQQ